MHVHLPKCSYHCISKLLSNSQSASPELHAWELAGYGNTAPNDCWGGIVVIAIQTILGIFLDAVVLGIIFSRLSHPKNRGRTIAISDSAVICRRDGILKFMFRIADFRSTQVRVHALFFSPLLLTLSPEPPASRARSAGTAWLCCAARPPSSALPCLQYCEAAT